MDEPGELELGEGARVGRGASKGSDTSGKVWSVYLSEADRQDRALAENWKGDTEGILIFTGLFAATVAAFIIESYKQLSPDSSTATVFLLNQISQQLSSLPNSAQVSSPSPPTYSNSSFRPTPSAIRVNILWFLSLALSLICALAATLMQQWARRYLQQAQAQTTLYKRARTREYLFQGVQAFRLSQAVEAVPALLHVAVFLFFAGLVDFLFPIDSTVGHVILGVMCFFGAIYVLLTFLPNIRPICPYRTPFSRDSLKWILVVPTASVLLGVCCLRCFVRSEMFEKIRMRFLLFVQSLLWTMSDAMRSLQEDIDKKALQWAVATVDDDDDIEMLLEGIPGYLTSGRNAIPIVEDLLDLQHSKPLGHHINRLIQTCTPEGNRGAPENVRRHRALICLDTARFLTGTYYASFSYGMFGYQTWPSVNSLKRDDDPAIAINAISTGALAARAYMRSVVFAEGVQQTPGDHAQRLFEFVNAPWPKDRLYSYAGCHLLVLQGFISALLPHLSSEEAVPATSFRAVWETLPRILNKYPRGSSAGDLEPHVKKSFLELWAELGTLAGTEPPPALPWGSVMISGSEPIRFKKHVMDADGVLPVVQLMSMLRQTVERLQMQDAQVDNGNAQETQAQVHAQDNSTAVEEVVPPPAPAAPAEQVSQSP